MIRSMTGFGSKSYEFSWGTVSLEISSVNSKYQDFSVRLPAELSSLENRLLALLRKLIARGRVRLSADINWAPGGRIPIVDDEGLVKLFEQVRSIAAANNFEVTNDITNLLTLPGVLDFNDNLAEQEARERPELWDKMVTETVEVLTESRLIEGKAMQVKIESDLKELDTNFTNMQERWKVAKEAALDGIRQRIEDVLKHYNLELDEARISEEVALLSDRWDISEEITRMNAHCEKFHQTLKLDEPIGKKLDFLIQEMNREINTMGSKVADAEFRWGVVEAKTCIERIREQIQNVE